LITNFNNKPFLFDGAFGTYYNKVSAKNPFCEYANINEHDTVLKIHNQYITAGAKAIKTNTYGANSILSENFEDIVNIIRSGYDIATQAARNANVIVFADIGYINSDKEDVAKEYVELSQVFINCGAKHFLFETFAEYEVLKPAIKHIKKCAPDSFIVLSFAVLQDGYTKKGHYYKSLISESLKNKEIDAIGLNCICGPSHLYNLIKELDLKNVTFSAMPNSGYPSTVNGRTVYEDNAEYFSEKLADIYKLGVKIIGGCCGTTPAHIKAIANKLSGKQIASQITTSIETPARHATPQINSFKNKMLSNKKIIAVELDPPIDTNCDYLISAAKKALSAGADIITLADSPLARARADSIMLAAKIKRESNIDVLPHLSCRDRNYIGIKAALLGANIEKINNILVITGDPVAKTDRGNCKGVFNFNSFNLISYISSLNTEVFSRTPFFIGGALNVNSLKFKNELKRAARKIENGAGFLLTQPIFSDEAVSNLCTSKNKLDCKILAGILPIAGYKNALFLNNEVSGITIPENVIESLKDKTPEQSADISTKYSLDIISKISDQCDGYYLMTPLKKIDLVCGIIDKIRKY